MISKLLEIHLVQSTFLRNPRSHSRRMQSWLDSAWNPLQIQFITLMLPNSFFLSLFTSRFLFTYLGLAIVFLSLLLPFLSHPSPSPSLTPSPSPFPSPSLSLSPLSLPALSNKTSVTGLPFSQYYHYCCWKACLHRPWTDLDEGSPTISAFTIFGTRVGRRVKAESFLLWHG